MLSKNSLGSEHFEDQNNVRSFICTACHHVPHHDMAFELTECGHILCEGCLNGLRQAGQACPNCKRPIGYSYRSLKADNKTAYRILMNLAVRCPNKCSWSGALSYLDKHLANCVKVPAYNYGSPYLPSKEISTRRKVDERIRPTYSFGSSGLSVSYIEDFLKLVQESERRIPQSVVSEEKKSPPVQKKPFVPVVGNNYKVSVHKHFLKHIKKDGWVCNGMSIPGGCKSKFTEYRGFEQTKGQRRFRCSDCDYDLCEKCVEAYLTN